MAYTYFECWGACAGDLHLLQVLDSYFSAPVALLGGLQMAYITELPYFLVSC